MNGPALLALQSLWRLSPPLPEQDCCLGLNCETAFYRPARQKEGWGGVLQTSTTLVSCDGTNNKTIKRLHEELCCTRLPVWGPGRIAGLAMTRLPPGVKRLDAGGHGSSSHTAGFDCQSEATKKGVAIKYGERQNENVKMKANRYSYVQNKNTFMYRSVTLQRSFFYIQCNHEILLGTG